IPSGSFTSETSSSWPPSWNVVRYLTSFWVMMSGPEPAARSAVTSVLYSVGSYSLSVTVMSEFFSWNASASAWNSGVVSRLHPESVSDTGPDGSAGVSLPALQPVRASAATAAMLPAARIFLFMLFMLLRDRGGSAGEVRSGRRSVAGGGEPAGGAPAVRPDDVGA